MDRNKAVMRDMKPAGLRTDYGKFTSATRKVINVARRHVLDHSMVSGLVQVSQHTLFSER